MQMPRLNTPAIRALAAGIVLQAFFWGGYSVKGNDTGGIIPYRAGADEYALQLAGQHCMFYGKYAVITSVHPWPGDYIGFVCRRAGRWGPAYNGW
jgi:hypothetical protein